MRIVITTQAVDRDDPILGFFHRWLIEFSQYFDHIDVICLREGVHELPENISVHSLGKESGENRLKYVFRFYMILIRLRGHYDAVFSHMNPHYILLAGLYWLSMGKAMYLWRNHARMNLMTEIAARFAREVYYTSRFACTTKYKHAVQMPVGIDTTLFVPQKFPVQKSDVTRILLLGRLSPVKRVEVVIAAVELLGAGYELHIYGDDTSKDKTYIHSLRTHASERVIFHGAVKNYETPAIYGSHDVYVNITPKGSMDKAVLEAAACGIPVIAANASFNDTLPAEQILDMPDAYVLKEAILSMRAQSADVYLRQSEEIRERIIALHSLEQLGKKLSQHLHHG